ncbi:unnamed protein product, partial [Gongylonema pulchrum]|uniref:Tyrosine aminotransferase n=1 Tax=Gongylonema pulchrum TaxID=637853 RepID=A0A183CV64_9BILA
DENDDESHNDWTVPVSEHAKNTVNPIRQICDSLVVTKPKKLLLRLDLGDPTISGALPANPVAIEAITEALNSRKYEGYGPAVGIWEAREAIASHFTHPDAPVRADSVLLTSGCSHALKMAIEALANPGDNILVPAPGFSLYSTLIRPLNIEERHYRIDLSNGAQLDIAQLKSLVDERTRAIIINNPPNPTSVVISKEQLESVLRIAYEARIPIIADEVYGTMAYNGAQFYPLATLKPKVPVLTCDGIAKRYLLPGWRLGWIIVHNRYGALTEIREGLVALAQKIVGPCALIQGALPRILQCTGMSFFEAVNKIISCNAKIAFDSLSRVPGLRPLMPNGAMFMIIAIDKQIYGTEEAFVQDLLAEESVFCLPGRAFYCSGWFRLVLAHSHRDIREACSRIVEFCSRRRSATCQ